jgi:hypothetical protein
MREIVRRLPSAAHSERGHRRRAARIGALMSALALTGAATVACTPPPSGPTAQEQFCTLWDKVGADEVAADNAVLVKSDVVAFADGAAQVGSACDASGAKVELDAAVLAEGKEIAEEQGTSSTDKVAAVTGDEIGAAEPVLDNIELRALNAQIGVGGITVTGNVAVRLSGTTSTIGFTGTVSNLDNWSVSLASSGLTIPGVTTSPVVFSGKLAVAGGVPTLTMSASASTVKVGDITVTGAAVSLTASQNTGVSASVKGAIKVGPSSATGNVAISFDEAGALVSANADVSARLVGTQAGGKKIDLTGTVHLEGNATETAISFSGSGILGDLQINEAAGSLVLATNKATFVGKLDVAQGNTYVRFNGSIVWDGITAYTPFLSVEGAGEFSGTLDDGTAVAVAGNVSTEIVGGQVRSVVTGNFKIGTLKANGTAVVQMSGATTTLEISADLDTAGFTGRLEGAVVITDGPRRDGAARRLGVGSAHARRHHADERELRHPQQLRQPARAQLRGRHQGRQPRRSQRLARRSVRPERHAHHPRGRCQRLAAARFVGHRQLLGPRARGHRAGRPLGHRPGHHHQLPARDRVQRHVHLVPHDPKLVAVRRRSLPHRLDRCRQRSDDAQPSRGHEGDPRRLLLLDHRDSDLPRSRLLHEQRRRVLEGPAHGRQLPGSPDRLADPAWRGWVLGLQLTAAH